MVSLLDEAVYKFSQSPRLPFSLSALVLLGWGLVQHPSRPSTNLATEREREREREKTEARQYRGLTTTLIKVILIFSADEGECIKDAQEFLVKFCNEKCSLMKGNRTHMLLRMSNLSVNDSGRYKNEIYYTGLQSEVEIEDFELKVLGRNKS